MIVPDVPTPVVIILVGVYGLLALIMVATLLHDWHVGRIRRRAAQFDIYRHPSQRRASR